MPTPKSAEQTRRRRRRPPSTAYASAVSDRRRATTPSTPVTDAAATTYARAAPGIYTTRNTRKTRAPRPAERVSERVREITRYIHRTYSRYCCRLVGRERTPNERAPPAPEEQRPHIDPYTCVGDTGFSWAPATAAVTARRRECLIVAARSVVVVCRTTSALVSACLCVRACVAFPSRRRAR